MPKQGKLCTSKAGLVIGLSTHHGILQKEITHIYLPHFCHHGSVRTVCDCARTKEKSLRLRAAASRTDVLYFAVFVLFYGGDVNMQNKINLPLSAHFTLGNKKRRKCILGVVLLYTDKFSVYLLCLDCT